MHLRDDAMSGLEVAVRQHIGDRTEQQDAARSTALIRGPTNVITRQLLVVADGMGGMEGGAVAARTAVRVLREHVTAAWNPERTRVEQLVDAFRATHREVQAALGERDGGCALTAAYLRGGPGGIVCFAHAGDVSGWLLRRDRTWAGKPYTVVHRTEAHRYGRHALSRCIGSRLADRDKAEVTADLPLQAGDVVVLASDGVADAVGEARMLAMVRPDLGPGALATNLLAAALRAASEGRDNATVMVARVGRGFLAAPGH